MDTEQTPKWVGVEYISDRVKLYQVNIHPGVAQSTTSIAEHDPFTTHHNRFLSNHINGKLLSYLQESENNKVNLVTAKQIHHNLPAKLQQNCQVLTFEMFLPLIK